MSSPVNGGCNFSKVILLESFLVAGSERKIDNARTLIPFSIVAQSSSIMFDCHSLEVKPVGYVAPLPARLPEAASITAKLGVGLAFYRFTGR